MPKHDCTALPIDEGLKLRRLYFTIGATVVALEWLVRCKDSPEHVAVAADTFEILHSRLNEALDNLGIPHTWRDVYPKGSL